MTSEISDKWIKSNQEKLMAVEIRYSEAEKEKIKFEYLHSLLTKLPELGIESDDELVSKIGATIEYLPLAFEELIYESYKIKLDDIIYSVKKRYNLTHKNFYQQELNPLSLSKANLIGLIISLVVSLSILAIFKLLYLVLIIGPILAVINASLLRRYFDKRAHKEGSVI